MENKQRLETKQGGEGGIIVDNSVETNVQLTEGSRKNRLVDGEYKKRYMSVRAKFAISLCFATIWLFLSVFLARNWYSDLASLTNAVFAAIVIAGVALVPGFMNAFLVSSLILDRQPRLANIDLVHEPVTVLIAAYNEEAGIYHSLEYIGRQSYQGAVKVIVVDNNSTDNTSEEVLRASRELNMDIKLLSEPQRGKFNALNRGLQDIETKFFIALDADTLIHKDGLAYLMARMKASPANVIAVAGSMLVKNSRENLITKIQEWDYFLSIASVKRMQGLYQGTLVAQGAFSLFKTDAIRELGGWPEAIGEDIVVTWELLAQDEKVYFEPCAVAFTTVPSTLRMFARQRARWARGMLEGIRAVKPWQQPSLYHKVCTGFDLFIPLVDTCYTLCWIPGLVLAIFFGNYAIVGPMALLVLPLTLVVFGILYYHQTKYVFKTLDLKVRRNFLGFVFFMFIYQAIMSPVALYGYLQEAFGARRVWK